MAQQGNQSRKIDTTESFTDSSSKETPDILLTKFLRSGDIVAGTSNQSPQSRLKAILNDQRWTRRMLENWFQKGPQSKLFSVTPDPEFRAVYLVLLAMLEENGKDSSGQGESSESASIHKSRSEKRTLTAEEQEEGQRRLDESILEHFNPGSTWEQI